MRLILVALALATGLFAAPSPAQAATPWNVAVLIFRSVDTVCHGQHMAWGLLSNAYDPAAMAQRYASTVGTWSDGEASVQLTIIEAGTLRDVTEFGSDCWPAPGDVPLPSGYDSYVLMYDRDGDDGSQLNAVGGLAVVGLTSGGYTYATVGIPDGSAYWQGAGMWKTMIHEWLNGVIPFYRSRGYTGPSAYDQAQYGYTSGSEAWYSDLMGGDIAGGIGLTTSVWAIGTPTGWTPEPAPKPCKNPNSNGKSCRP